METDSRDYFQTHSSVFIGSIIFALSLFAIRLLFKKRFRLSLEAGDYIIVFALVRFSASDGISIVDLRLWITLLLKSSQ